MLLLFASLKGEGITRTSKEDTHYCLYLVYLEFLAVSNWMLFLLDDVPQLFSIGFVKNLLPKMFFFFGGGGWVCVCGGGGGGGG